MDGVLECSNPYQKPAVHQGFSDTHNNKPEQVYAVLSCAARTPWSWIKLSQLTRPEQPAGSFHLRMQLQQNVLLWTSFWIELWGFFLKKFYIIAWMNKKEGPLSMDRICLTPWEKSTWASNNAAWGPPTSEDKSFTTCIPLILSY